MFACLHSEHGDLLALAAAFSPVVEQTGHNIVVFSIDGLGRLIGTPDQIASEICRCGAGRGIHANLAIASNPDTAALAAENISGVTIIPPGEEADILAHLSIGTLASTSESALEILETFESWGIRTLADLAELPEMGLASRFGEEGVRLRRLALGGTHRTLRVILSTPLFARRTELDYPMELLEPLLFVLSSMLHELTGEMAQQGLASNRVELALELEGKLEHRRILEFAVPCGDPQTLLKLVQFDLEAHAPEAPILAARIELHPASPQVLQRGLFLPASPEPQKLQLVLSRLAGLVGEENAGSPTLLDTYRPDAYAMRPFRSEPARESEVHEHRLRLAFRFFRPPLNATVHLREDRPVSVTAPGVRGTVRTASGPWRSSGDWWTETQWAREEWDVDLNNNAIYRIYYRLDSRHWFVEGVYD